MFNAEGITAATDYALAAASVGFAIAIGRSLGPATRVSAWFWCAGFIAAAGAGAAGGTFHAIATESQEARWQLWTLSMASMGASGAFMTAGIHAAYVQRKDGTVAWLIAGIAVTLVGAAVLGAQFPGSAYLDQNGAYHLIQIAGLYLFYRCARTVHDRPGVPPEVRPDARLELGRGSRRRDISGGSKKLSRVPCRGSGLAVREAERDVHAGIIPEANGDDDVWPAVRRVGHRPTGLSRRHPDGADLLPCLLVVGAEHRAAWPAGWRRHEPVAEDDQRSGDEHADIRAGSALAGLRDVQTFQRRMIPNDVRCVAMRHL